MTTIETRLCEILNELAELKSECAAEARSAYLDKKDDEECAHWEAIVDEIGDANDSVLAALNMM